MPTFTILKPPTEGTAITRKNGRLVVPDDPIVPFIEGDGTGPDIWRASVRVFDAAVQKAYGGKKRIVWFEVPAGRESQGSARRVAAERHARGRARLQDRDQGAR
jgi:isocitrate dehydrogenase